MNLDEEKYKSLLCNDMKLFFLLLPVASIAE